MTALQNGPEPTKATCKVCGCAGVAIRISRTGFMQRKVLSRLGIYPWKCGACGSMFLYRSRGHGDKSRRKSRMAGQGHGRSSSNVRPPAGQLLSYLPEQRG